MSPSSAHAAWTGSARIASRASHTAVHINEDPNVQKRIELIAQHHDTTGAAVTAGTTLAAVTALPTRCAGPRAVRAAG